MLCATPKGSSVSPDSFSIYIKSQRDYRFGINGIAFSECNLQTIQAIKNYKTISNHHVNGINGIAFSECNLY